MYCTYTVPLKESARSMHSDFGVPENHFWLHCIMVTLYYGLLVVIPAEEGQSHFAGVMYNGLRVG